MTVRDTANPNTDPIVVGPPWRRGYGQWQITRMSDVRTVLSDPSTMTDALTVKALDYLRAQKGDVAPTMARLVPLIARVHRTPNDAERLDAIAVTKLLLAALPSQDFRAPFTALTSNGGTSTDAMTGILRQIVMPWRADALQVDGALAQQFEDGILSLIIKFDRVGVAGIASLEPEAAQVMKVLAKLMDTRRGTYDIPPTHWISPAFLAINPLSMTSVSMLANLAENQTLQEDLRNRPNLRPGYVREVERLMSAFRYLMRMAGSDGIVLGDVRLPPRSLIVLDLAAANRDPELSDDPDTLRLDRARQQTATFSFGSLACTGGQLSRQFLGRLLDAALETTRLSLPTPGSDPDRQYSEWSINRGYSMCRLHFAPL